mmetsp:Transcript_7956/g.29430  ORF Transcript_7956/g.29430 Transcript_7956/m.29430 type:complete len:720 (-) Transcript_7956:1570-3729(-)|eukprot:scaffold1328_cov394-Prasinococcus_capsulatus_cf.AAC.2
MAASPRMKKKPRDLDVDDATWQAILQAQEELRRQPRGGYEYSRRTQARTEGTTSAQPASPAPNRKAASTLGKKTGNKKSGGNADRLRKRSRPDYREEFGNTSNGNSKRSNSSLYTNSSEEDEAYANSRGPPKKRLRKKLKYAKSKTGTPRASSAQRKKETVAAGGVRKVMVEVLGFGKVPDATNSKDSAGADPEDCAIASDAEWEAGLGAELRSARQLALAIAALRPELPPVRFESTEGKGHSLLRSQDPALRAQNSQHLRHGRFKKAHLVDIYRNLVRKSQDGQGDADAVPEHVKAATAPEPESPDRPEASLMEVAHTLFTFRMTPMPEPAPWREEAPKAATRGSEDLRAEFVHMFLDCVAMGEAEGAADCVATKSRVNKCDASRDETGPQPADDCQQRPATPPTMDRMAHGDGAVPSKDDTSFGSPRLSSPGGPDGETVTAVPAKSPAHMVSATVRHMDEIGFWFVSPLRPTNDQLREWASIVPAFVQWRYDVKQGVRDSVTAARVRAALSRLYQVYSVRGPRVEAECVCKELEVGDLDQQGFTVRSRFEMRQQAADQVFEAGQVGADPGFQGMNESPGRESSDKDGNRVIGSSVGNVKVALPETNGPLGGQQSKEKIAEPELGQTQDLAGTGQMAGEEKLESSFVEAAVRTEVISATVVKVEERRQNGLLEKAFVREKIVEEYTQETATTDKSDDVSVEHMESQGPEVCVGITPSA